MIDLTSVMLRLARTRPVFHSEADFQHALAWQLQIEHPKARIRLEYRPLASEKMYTDIWFALGDKAVAIELKYPTRHLSTTFEDESFVLANHGAQDLVRYDFIKDLVRLERVADQKPGTQTAAILLTNDPLYWDLPNSTRITIDAAFRVHHGRTLNGMCAWSERAGRGTTRTREVPLDLRSSYFLDWQAYSIVDDSVPFKFALLEPKSAQQ